jgi:hypothetical protein
VGCFWDRVPVVSLRSIPAFNWLRILWRCWRDSKTYDDALYLAHLRERKAPLLDFLPAA